MDTLKHKPSTKEGRTMFRPKHHLFLLLLGLSCVGCAGQMPFDLDTTRNGTGKTLHAPIQMIQSRTITLDPQRSTAGQQPLSSADTRSVLNVTPEAVAFLSNPTVMLSKNSDGSVGIRIRTPLAFDRNRSEALQAVLVNPRHTLLSRAMTPYLFPACPLPD